MKTLDFSINHHVLKLFLKRGDTRLLYLLKEQFSLEYFVGVLKTEDNSDTERALPQTGKLQYK